MNQIKSYVLSNMFAGRGAYANLTGGVAYSEATNACSQLIAAGFATRDLKITAAGREAFLSGKY